MTKMSSKKRYGNLQQGLSPRTQQRIAERAGYTLVQLHALWDRRQKGDAEADQRLKSILNEQPEVWKLLDRFSKGASQISSHKGVHEALTAAVMFKRSASIWARTKPKWLDVSPGGLPTLGKRR